MCSYAPFFPPLLAVLCLPCVIRYIDAAQEYNIPNIASIDMAGVPAIVNDIQARVKNIEAKQASMEETLRAMSENLVKE